MRDKNNSFERLPITAGYRFIKVHSMFLNGTTQGRRDILEHQYTD
jgi:hypothetical protein